MIEKWKDIKEFEGLYQISDKGNVKSLERYIVMKNGKSRFYPEKILKHGKNNRGYHKVELYTLDSKKTTHLIARLVAEAFIENPENKPQVNHKTGDKDKNSADDLEWTNQSENMLHAYKTGLRTYKEFVVSEETREKMSKAHKGKDHYVKKVAQIDPNTNEKINIFNSVREAALFIGCHETSISEVARHKKGRILTKGFKWEFM